MTFPSLYIGGFISPKGAARFSVTARLPLAISMRYAGGHNVGFQKSQPLYKERRVGRAKGQARISRVSLAQLVREIFDRFLGIPTVAAQVGRTRLYASNAAG
jgi:hypothetical protein